LYTPQAGTGGCYLQAPVAPTPTAPLIVGGSPGGKGYNLTTTLNTTPYSLGSGGVGGIGNDYGGYPSGGLPLSVGHSGNPNGPSAATSGATYGSGGGGGGKDDIYYPNAGSSAIDGAPGTHGAVFIWWDY
jgi:hypothetical protein